MSTVTEDQTIDPEVEDQAPEEVEQEEQPEVEQSEPETFDRPYVEKLRKEAADARVRAKDRDTLAAALWAANVAATGRLADATDLGMPEGADPLNAEAVEVAVTELLARKPHLASRKPRGDVGQGMTGSTSSVDLAGMLRSRA